MIEMMFAAGVLFTPIVLLVALFYIFWYGYLFFCWILFRLPELIDDFVGIIYDISYSSSRHFQGFTQQDFSSKNSSRKNQDFSRKDSSRENYSHKDGNQPSSQTEDPKGYYKILGVSYNTTVEEIKSAYWKLAKEYHPDLHPTYSDEIMKKINLAKEILTDPIKRAKYDRGEEIK